MGEEFLTADEMAQRLKVPISWIYNQTRQKGEGRIPVIRVGKYCRFVETEVLAWLKQKQGEAEAI